jgi:hypothetical protein
MFASRHERMAGMPALALGALIAAVGPIGYLISKSVWSKSRPAVAAGD